MFNFFKRNSYHSGDGMILSYDDNTKKQTLKNSGTGEVFELVNDNGKLLHFKKEDIDFDRVNRLEDSENAAYLQAPYGFHVDPYVNGVTLISWTLYPDGRYFADEYGFGGESNSEVTVYAYMDTHGKVIIPFRDMTNDEIKEFRIKAEQLVKGYK